MITRIRQLLDSQGLSPTQFADLIGVGRPVMSHILSERNKPSLDVVQRIIGAFPEVSLPWLLSGTGDMLHETVAATPTSSTAPENSPATTPSTASTQASAPSPAAPTPPPAAQPLDPAPVSQLEEPFVAAARPLTPAKPAVELISDIAAPLVSAAAPVAKPFRAARFVPAAAATPAAAAFLPPTLLPSEPSPAAPLVRDASAASAASPVAEAPAASLPLSNGPAPNAALPYLPEPGKAIRRIVIFYRDGSFADYQPEQ